MIIDEKHVPHRFDFSEDAATGVVRGEEHWNLAESTRDHGRYPATHAS